MCNPMKNRMPSPQVNAALPMTSQQQLPASSQQQHFQNMQPMSQVSSSPSPGLQTTQSVAPQTHINPLDLLGVPSQSPQTQSLPQPSTPLSQHLNSTSTTSQPSILTVSHFTDLSLPPRISGLILYC